MHSKDQAMRFSLLLTSAIALSSPALSPAVAGSLTLAPSEITEWKAVYGQVEARDTV